MVARCTSAGRLSVAVVASLAVAAPGAALAAPEHPSLPAANAESPGEVYFTANRWVEYHAGNLPIVISAPHGGHLAPASIPDRTRQACGGAFTATTDINTAELARSLKYRFHEYTGGYPHVVISRLKRTKLDPNRPEAQGACGSRDAEAAWRDFHGLIGLAKKRTLSSSWGRGWYIDLHGFRGSKAALGYRLSREELRLDDATLNADPSFRDKSTFRTFAARSPFEFAPALLRGDQAFGTVLGRHGYPSIPSLQHRAPENGERYFRGGYNSLTHGCGNGGDVCGLQIEAPYPGIRDTRKNRKAFARAVVRATDVFLGHNFGFSLWSPKGEIVVDNHNPANDTSKAVFEASSNWVTDTDGEGTYLRDFRSSTGDGLHNGPHGGPAAFKFRVPAAGSYSLYVRWPGSGAASTSARYRVFETIGGRKFHDSELNQRIDGGKWNLLGTWNWTTGGWAQVLVSQSLSGSGQPAADAVRVVRR